MAGSGTPPVGYGFAPPGYTKQGYAFVWSSIQFREAGEWLSPRGAMSGSAERKFPQYLVPWASMDAAELALIGTCTRKVVGTTPYLSRQVPHAYPSKSYLFASEVTKAEPEGTVIGVPDSNRIATFTDCRMDVIYSRLPYDILSDASSTDVNGDVSIPRDVVAGVPTRYIVRKAPVSKEKQLTYREGSWQFTDTGRLCSTVTARSYSLLSMQWVWMQVPFVAVPFAFIASSVGFLNNATFDGWGPGTLLLRAPTYQMDGLPDGQRSCNVTITADYNPLGWNTTFDPLRNNQFYPIGRLAAINADGTGVVGSGVVALPYPAVINFSELFQPV